MEGSGRKSRDSFNERCVINRYSFERIMYVNVLTDNELHDEFISEHIYFSP